MGKIPVSKDGVMGDLDPTLSIQSGDTSIETKQVSTLTYTDDSNKTVSMRLPLLPAIGQTYEIELDKEGFVATVNSDGTYTVRNTRNTQNTDGSYSNEVRVEFYSNGVTMKLTIHEIAQVVGAKNDWSQLADLSVNKIEFDSRLIEKGDIFLPLKGARDGHDFIEIAFDNGAIISFSEKEVEQAHLLVDDNLLAFQKLAKYYLEKTKVPVIAVTGSNGKTTTKDMIAAVLSKKFKTYKTQGNHNNEIGLPYTILHMPDDTEKLVLEMGMDHPGDIDFLSELAKPELAVITLIGEAHLEHMGSRENIAKGKMGITAGLHGELIAPADPIINAFIPDNQKIIRFGLPGEDLFITKLVEHKEKLTFETNFLDESITIPVPGKYNATNAMLAAFVGLHYGLSEAEIKKALKEVELTRNRTEWKKAKNGADLLSDV